jgi:hypothetical protein
MKLANIVNYARKPFPAGSSIKVSGIRNLNLSEVSDAETQH